MKRIAVFCGSSFGNDSIFEAQAKLLGRTLAQQDLELVYGGANVGLMGAVADGALEAGGKVIGVLPHFLKEKEIAHENLTQLFLVNNMHERKSKISELSDGVIALPGGFGTMEELFEVLTWGQLGLHKKPIGLLNVDGFYNPLMTMAQQMVEKGFMKEIYQKNLLVSGNIDDLLNQMKAYVAPAGSKWIEKENA